MTEAIRGALGSLAAELARSAGIATTDILELALVGNPIMHHLVLGLDPVELGGAPFALAVDQALTIPASALGLAVHPNARVYVLPCIAGHVGADAAGMILASGRPGDAMTLLVDVGTNAEIVLGNRDRLLACSSPTGPAFEGAQISCGQRAAPGAIERVRIDPATLEPRVKVIGSDSGRTTRASPPRPRAPESPASAAPGSSRSSPRCTWPASSTRTASWTARSPRRATASSPDGRTFATCCTAATCR
jgi:uncharacterized 2Fe-2S/4Fe-4S cluster protein (DUF4445 family)